MIPTVRTELRAPGRWDPQRSRIRDSPLPAGRSASPRHLSLRTCPVHSGRLTTLPVQSLWPYAFIGDALIRRLFLSGSRRWNEFATFQLNAGCVSKGSTNHLEIGACRRCTCGGRDSLPKAGRLPVRRRPRRWCSQPPGSASRAGVARKVLRTPRSSAVVMAGAIQTSSARLTTGE